MKSSPLIRDSQHKKNSSLLFFFLPALGALFFLQNITLSATPAEMNAIDPVQVTDAGNQGDSSAYGWGSVSYEFWIGKNDVTVGEYAIFLNAVAQKDALHLYDSRMWSDRWPLIQRLGPDAQGNFSYQASTAMNRYPIIFINYKNAQRYCNWLENGKPSGDEVAGITETGTYDLLQSTTTIATARKKATFQLPTNDEYHKVTYYKGGSLSAGFYRYPTQTDTLPQSHSMDPNGTHNVNIGLSSQGTDGRNFLQNVGNTLHLTTFPYETYDGCNPRSIGFYGTHDDGCNVAQWTSTTDSSGSFLLVRGADWDYWDHNTNIWDPFYYAASTSFRVQTPDAADEHVGFRVVGIKHDSSKNQTSASSSPLTSSTSSVTPPPSSHYIIDPIAPENLQPNTEEFKAARAAYVTANNNYHEANDAYFEAYASYREIQDPYIDLCLKQKDLSEKGFQIAQTDGRSSAKFIKLQSQYNHLQHQTDCLWISHLKTVDDLQQSAGTRNQEEQAYLQARAEYLNASAQMSHTEDEYDQNINCYNEKIDEYIAAASPFLKTEADWMQALAQYHASLWQLAITDEVNQTEDEKKYFSNSQSWLEQEQPLYDQAKLQFQNVQNIIF